MSSSLVLLCVLLLASGTLAGSCREAALCCPGRDSSCVVQKAPPNAIIEDLSDKPCYCDHACLKLGDCCTDFKDACGVVDCVVSPWGPWSACDAECGSGSMSRSRTVQLQPRNGGRHCPSLQQRRGCQMGACPQQHSDPAAREMAMILPGTLSLSRHINETSDIRRNLRMREDHSESDKEREYCVEFEVLKASKACRKELQYSTLREGSRVCVVCEAAAWRRGLGLRCAGHGAVGRSSRWSALAAPHCRGKWLRQPHQPQCSTCSLNNNSTYIFV